jgi:hypothetical protein
MSVAFVGSRASLTRKERTVLFESHRPFFDESVPPRRPSALGADRAALLRRLAGFEVDADASAPERACSVGHATVASVCPLGGDCAELAELAYRASRALGDSEPFTVVVAATRQPKTLVHDRPLRMRDVNSGVTYRERGDDALPARLIVLWRWDSKREFCKVLLHELVHLCLDEDDEAVTEATALDLWCVWQARTRDEHERVRERVKAHLRELSADIASVDVGKTNAARYWAIGACYFMREPGRECHAPPPAPLSLAPPKRFTALPEND